MSKLRNKLLLVVLMCALVCVPLVRASTTTNTLTYDELNDALDVTLNHYFYKGTGLSANYTTYTWTITEDLTWNASNVLATEYVSVRFSDDETNQTDIAETGFWINFYGDDTINCYYTNGTGAETLFADRSYTSPVSVELDNGTLTITDADALSGTVELTLGHTYSTVLAYKSKNAEAASGTVTDGTLIVSCTYDDMTPTINEWMPMIVSFAMLGVVLGMFKDIGRENR